VTARQRSTTAVKRWLFLRFFGSLDVKVTGCTSSSSNDPVRPHTTAQREGERTPPGSSLASLRALLELGDRSDRNHR
jgi:hypothetical protein